MLTGEILARSAAQFPDRTAIIVGEQRLDYRALDQAASRFAHALIRHGLKPGERVGMLCGNRPEYAIAYFGIARAGGVSAHMSPRYLEDELVHALGVVEARYAAVDRPPTAKGDDPSAALRTFVGECGDAPAAVGPGGCALE